MASISLKVSISLLYLSLYGIASSDTDLTNISVARLITFAFELVKVKAEIEVQNNHKITANSYEFHIDSDVEIYHIEFFDKDESRLYFTKSAGKNIYAVNFSEPLKHLERTSIIVKQVHVDKLKSWYKTRKLNEENVMQYSGNVKYYSRYTTLAMATQYYTRKMSFLFEDSYSLKPTSLTNNSISYMFADVAPFSAQTINIHFICSNNYYRILNFDRTVDISMYGMIKITDNVVLKNTGPKLVGPFEPSLTTDRILFTISLPNGAQYIQYYDEIGLIRSYELKQYKDSLSIDFKPRYPLEGGWKVSYSLIYLIPIYKSIMYSKDGNLELNILANGHVLKDVLIEKATIKVLLPEGSSIVTVKADDELIRRGNRKVFSGLSLNGRKQIEFEGRNILNHYDMNVMIRFKQSIFYFLRAPFIITFHIFAVFLVVIFINRYKSFGSKY